MQKITSKTKAYIVLLVVVAITLFYFYKNPTVKQVNAQKCPEDYPETDAGFEEKNIAVDEWFANFRNQNPNASLIDIARARYQFYMDNNCSATLEKYFEMEQTETETEEEKILRETIQEEIHKQAAKNLFQALKEDENKQ